MPPTSVYRSSRSNCAGSPGISATGKSSRSGNLCCRHTTTTTTHARCHLPVAVASADCSVGFLLFLFQTGENMRSASGADRPLKPLNASTQAPRPRQRVYTCIISLARSRQMDVEALYFRSYIAAGPHPATSESVLCGILDAGIPGIPRLPGGLGNELRGISFRFRDEKTRLSTF